MTYYKVYFDKEKKEFIQKSITSARKSTKNALDLFWPIKKPG